MRKVISCLFDFKEAEEVKEANNRMEITPLLKKSFTEQELAVWQTKILTALTYNLPAIKLTMRLMQNKKLDPKVHMELLGEQASALGSNGQYRKAAKNHWKAAKIAKSKADPIKYFQHLNAASDAYRCNGKIIYSIGIHLWNQQKHQFQHKTIRSTWKSDEFKHVSARNEILLLSSIFPLTDKIPLIRTAVRNHVKNLLLQEAHKFHSQGDLYSYHQLKMVAIRLDISEDIFNRFDDSVVTLPPEQGYKQLLFPMGQMMEFRYRMNKKKGTLDKEELDQALQYLKLARALSIRPEIWKLLSLIRSKAPSHFTKDNQRELDMEFNNCEYTLFLKYVKRFLGH